MNSHHAVLLCADSPLTYSPEFYVDVPTHDQYRQQQFGIDDVRTLTQHAYRRPDNQATVRVILVATEFVTEEAQQALLKIIEEPPVSTKFVFVVPNGYSFLPTLESRFERQATEVESRDCKSFTIFQTGGYQDRLLQIEQALKAKNTSWQAEIKKGLIGYLQNNKSSITPEILSELEFIVRLLLTRGASNKFLLEHLALTLPA